MTGTDVGLLYEAVLSGLYVRARSLLRTQDRIEPAGAADVALLAELGYAKGLAWRPPAPMP